MSSKNSPNNSRVTDPSTSMWCDVPSVAMPRTNERVTQLPFLCRSLHGDPMWEYPYNGCAFSEKLHSSNETTNVSPITDASCLFLYSATWSSLTMPRTLFDSRFLENRMSRIIRRVVVSDSDSPATSCRRRRSASFDATEFFSSRKNDVAALSTWSVRLLRLRRLLFSLFEYRRVLDSAHQLECTQRCTVLGLTSKIRAVHRIPWPFWILLNANSLMSDEYIDQIQMGNKKMGKMGIKTSLTTI